MAASHHNGECYRALGDQNHTSEDVCVDCAWWSANFIQQRDRVDARMKISPSVFEGVPDGRFAGHFAAWLRRNGQPAATGEYRAGAVLRMLQSMGFSYQRVERLEEHYCVVLTFKSRDAFRGVGISYVEAYSQAMGQFTEQLCSGRVSAVQG